jgi:uncharacterized membrane protein
MNSRASRALWGVAAFLSVGVALFSYRVVAYLEPISPEILGNLFARPWLAVHAGCAATALVVGPFQLVPAIRRRRAIHRWLGRIYATGCIVGGLSGLRLAFGTTAGAFAGLGFGTLALLWIYATTQAWRFARERRFEAHGRWMVRSFAMTFAAVTLRLYLPVAPLLGFDFMDGYRLTAWISWIPNLILVELWMRRRERRLQPAAT